MSETKPTVEASEATNKPRKYVLVEAVQMHRMRYVVELLEEEPTEWALDTVTMQEAKELSQEDLGETIISHRVLAGGLAEAIQIARDDTPDVAGQWDDALVIKNHITPLREE